MPEQVSLRTRAPRSRRKDRKPPLLSACLVIVLGACAGPVVVVDEHARRREPIPASPGATTAARQHEKPVDGRSAAGVPPIGPADAKRETGIGRGLPEDDGGAVLPRFERFELVTAEASVADRTANRPGNGWGGHQTRVLRMQNGDVYTVYSTTGAAYYSSQWHLVRRDERGWQRVASGLAGREPVNILRTPSDGVAVVAWPKRAPLLTTFEFANGSITRHETPIPGQWETSDWPYNAAGIGLDGTLCALQSNLSFSPGAFSWACRNPPNGDWQFHNTSLKYRHCYAYVLPEGKHLHVIATRDVAWRTLGYARPPGNADFAVNQVHAFGTSDHRTIALAPTMVREEVPTAQYPGPVANGHVDAYVDTEGRLHVLYNLAGQSTAGVWQTRHALLVNGQVIADIQLPVQGYWRITQDSTGRFWALYGNGTRFAVYPALSSDGLELGQPTELNIGTEQVLYSGTAIAVPRAGVPLDDTIDGGFPSGSVGERWIYFRLRLR